MALCSTMDGGGFNMYISNVGTTVLDAGPSHTITAWHKYKQVACRVCVDDAGHSHTAKWGSA